MRVVLVTHYYPAHGGGVETVAGEIAQRLAARDDVEIVWHASATDAPPGTSARLQTRPAPAFNALEKRLGLPYPLWSPGALRALARDVRGADVVHLHDCLYLANLVASRAARSARRPVVVTQHVGLVPYRSRVLRVLHAAANRFLGARLLRRACRVVFIAEQVRRYFEHFGALRASSTANGVDTALFCPATTEARQSQRRKLGVSGDQLVLLFVGRFVEKKGLGLLEQLARRLPDALWLFAGAGPLDPARWGCANVRALGHLPKEDLAPLYQAADLLVLPSVGEGFPLVVQEAMACGTPALVDPSTADGYPPAQPLLLAEPVEGESAPQRWTERIRGAGPRAPELAGRLSRFAADHWSWERCADLHYEVMRECAAGGAR